MQERMTEEAILAVKQQALDIIEKYEAAVRKKRTPEVTPHYIDICIENEQNAPVWYTIEPLDLRVEHLTQGYCIKRDLFVTLQTRDMIFMGLNSRSYIPSDEVTWRIRIEMSKQYDPEYQVKWSKGIYSHGSRYKRKVNMPGKNDPPWMRR